MNVKQMVVEHLEKNGYDGLYAPDGECGCLIDDLAPCEEFQPGCLAGYMVQAPPGDENEFYVCHDPHAEPWLREEE